MIFSFASRMSTTQRSFIREILKFTEEKIIEGMSRLGRLIYEMEKSN